MLSVSGVEGREEGEVCKKGVGVEWIVLRASILIIKNLRRKT